MPRTTAGSRTFVSNRFTPRSFGKALAFNGTSTNLTVPVTPSTSGVSFAFWIYLGKATSQQRIVAWVAGGPNGGFFVEKPSSERLIKFDVYNGGGQAVDINSRGVKCNEWYHVACTFKTNEAKLYLNGVLQGTDTSCSMTTPAGQTLTIGSSSASAAQFFQGYMEQFVLENTDTPWTQTQIYDLYYRGIVPKTATVVYDFADNVNDSTANANTGTLSNGSYVTEPPSKTRTAAGSRFFFNMTTPLDRMRGWNYSSNYLNGSSTNAWYIQPNQIPYDALDISEAGIALYAIYGTEANGTDHLAGIDAVLAVDPHAKFLIKDFITYDTDYSVATGGTNRTSKINDFVSMVNIFKDSPAVIGFAFANENNLSGNRSDGTSIADWYSLVNAALGAGKAADDSGITRSWMTIDADLGTYPGDDYVPNLDVLGLNIYRGTTFTDLVDDIQAKTIKPVVITEFGRKRPDNNAGSQTTQAAEVLALIQEVESYFPTIRGWIHFKYTHTKVTDTGDEFWEASLPLAQGTYESREKMALYTTIKNYCTSTIYGG